MRRDEDRPSADGGEQLCWITGCMVGAAHPPALEPDEVLWQALERGEIEPFSSALEHPDVF